jgi:FkbM family methyltransferase
MTVVSGTQYNEYRYEEHQIIVDYFGDISGRFLCIGAGVGHDHLHPLLESDWTGVYCEPNPVDCASLLLAVAKFKDKVTIVNSAVTDKSGLAIFYRCVNGVGVSSLDPDHAESNKATIPNPTIQKIIVNTIAANKLIEFIGKDFNLISIDAEGSDSKIVKSIPWEELKQCQMIFVEQIDPDAHRILINNNFVLHTNSTSNHNRIYTKKLT